MQTSQENFTTIVYAKFERGGGRANRVHCGQYFFWKIENALLSIPSLLQFIWSAITFTGDDLRLLRRITFQTCCLCTVLWVTSAVLLSIERFSFEWRKVIGFAFTTLHDWLKKLAPLFHPIRSKTKINRDSLVRVFPRFRRHLLIGSLNYLCPLWLARVITLVLV